jgi:hypothetical protein
MKLDMLAPPHTESGAGPYVHVHVVYRHNVRQAEEAAKVNMNAKCPSKGKDAGRSS